MRNGPAGKAPDGAQAAAAAQATARATTPGGASGLPQTTQTAASLVKANVVQARPAGAKVTKYRVRNGGVVVFNGMRTALRAGKEVDARSYDLNHLRRQGIVLEEIPDDSPPEATAESTESNPFPGSGEYQPHASQAAQTQGPIPAPVNVAPKT